MNRFSKNIKIIYQDLRKDLFAILILCLSFIMLYDFVLSEIPEIFEGANKLGVFFYNLSLAYIAAYIFFFLNIFIRNQKEKGEINYYIARKVSQILSVAFTIIHELEESTDIKIKNKYPNEEELKFMTGKLNITGHSRLKSIIGTYATWPEYFNYHKVRTENYINKILFRMNFIDYKLVGLLSRIEDSSHFLNLEYKSVWEKSPSDFSFMSSALFDYFILNKELEDFYNEKLRIYMIN